MGSMHCNTDWRTVWTASGPMLKNRHLVTFYGLFSQTYMWWNFCDEVDMIFHLLQNILWKWYLNVLHTHTHIYILGNYFPRKVPMITYLWLMTFFTNGIHALQHWLKNCVDCKWTYVENRHLVMFYGLFSQTYNGNSSNFCDEVNMIFHLLQNNILWKWYLNVQTFTILPALTLSVKLIHTKDTYLPHSLWHFLFLFFWNHMYV